MSHPDDAALLKRFEPVLKFTKGEVFFPFNAADYVAEASLWRKPTDRPPEELISESDLDLTLLGALNLSGAGDVHYLQFISPMNIRQLAEFRLRQWRRNPDTPPFKAHRSRLTRVGYFARFVDALFSISLLLRGRVPGDSMAAAVVTFERMLAQNRRFQYYGRVVREGGWIILQYWFFYPFNNWRSGFNGGNDHEADWEMINIYVNADKNGDYHPAWTAYANHVFSGDDQRRHWQDPELEKIGEHPVVYVGGGSHAGYFQKGEYLTQISVPFLTPLQKFVFWVEKIFGKLFQEEQSGVKKQNGRVNVFKVPFVDYALGDGLCIGPGCHDSWSDPVLIDPPPDWVSSYRGLWGYYAQDPFSGEDAPAGPMYERNGEVRRAWYDPLGWAGMDHVLPPDEVLIFLNMRQRKAHIAIRALRREIEKLQDEVFYLGLDLEAMRDVFHLKGVLRDKEKEISEKQDALSEKRQMLTVQESLLVALKQYEAGLREGKPLSIRAHIHHPRIPQTTQSLRFGPLAEFWAAISIGLMMIAVVLLIVFAKQFLLVGLGALLLLLVTVEAAFRKRLWALTRGIALALALVALFVLLYEFFWPVLVVLIMLIGLYMIVENLRELFSRTP